MHVAQINMVHVGSTGKIMLQIANVLREHGQTAHTFSATGYARHYRMEKPVIPGHRYFGFRQENLFHIIADRLFCANGCGSFFGTLQLIRQLKECKPDIIHLHNLHNRTIHLGLLFRYIQRNKIPVVWTLHDCWTMTGRCPHFSMVKCVKWKTGCTHCSQLKAYPRAYVDLTSFMWKRKKKWFTSIADMTIVTPSQWLANLVGNLT